MRWPKVGVVAGTEFQNAVRTKAFLVGILMLPFIYAVAIVVQIYANKADTRPRPFAVIDHTGLLYPSIAKRAEARNQAVAPPGTPASGPRFVPSLIPEAGRSAEVIRLELSDRVRSGELFAFVEIPEALLAQDDADTPFLYHSNSPTDLDLLRWLEATLSDLVREQRFRQAGVDQAVVARLNAPVRAEQLGLVSRTRPVQPSSQPAGDRTAAIASAPKVDKVRAFATPIALAAVMFMVVMATTPQLLQTVLEEKMSKISEVLLGSVTPLELMMGKLLGHVGVALVLAGLYVGAAYGVAIRYGYGDLLSPPLIAAAVLFIFLGVMLFGSLFMAVGSACSDMKDAQSLMFPVLMLAIMPTFFWTAVLTRPSSPVAVGVSLFPPATPFLMLMRLALSPPPPAWQVVLSIVLTTATAFACVWASARIFRTGLLLQGKAPDFRELARWVFTP